MITLESIKIIEMSSENGTNNRKLINKGKNRKQEAGVTLVAMVVTIVVLMMIAIPYIVNIKTVSETDKFTKLKNDITNLEESISQVYGENDNISKIGPKYTGDTGSSSFLYINQGELGAQKTSKDVVKNPNDNENYYVINVSKLKKNLKSKLGIGLADLNYGNNNYGISVTLTELNAKDVYIINEKSRTIYYNDGVRYKSGASGKEYIYYRLPEDYTKVSTNTKCRANAPVLKKGMTPVKFEEPTEKSEGKIVTTTVDDENWYNYCERRWANVRTEDGSLWVWIPRFAYRINKPDASDKEQKGTTSVVFLNGLTDKYYDDNGKEGTAKRCKSTDDVVDTTTGYTVHPAFTNESSIGYRNGGWDSELYGIWVAKFEAAYATTSNVSSNKVNVSSGLNYTQTQVWAPQEVVKTENSAATGDGWAKARNYVDGAYGTTTTSIKYPTFQGSSYSMNYINHNDAYVLSKKLTANGNIYGLSTDTDSHMMKNSEWGAVAYLSKSFYGIEKIDIAVNSKNANNDTNNVHAVTGYNSDNKKWNEYLSGTMSASTTGNIYGIYDMSGGTWERVAAYINNSWGKESRKKYGASVSIAGDNSTKYTKIYLSREMQYQNTDDERGQINYSANTKIYGDAIFETSIKGKENYSWYSDFSYFPEGPNSFFFRGGTTWDGVNAGLFYFHRWTRTRHI